MGRTMGTGTVTITGTTMGTITAMDTVTNTITIEVREAVCMDGLADEDEAQNIQPG